MSFLKSLLSRIKPPEQNFSVSIDCGPVPKVLDKNDQFKVLFPPKASEDNVVTLSGGCIAKLNVGDYVEDLLGESFTFYNKVAQKQASEVNKAFDTIINPYSSDEKISFNNYNKSVRIKINDAIINRVTDTDIRSFPNFYLSTTKVQNGILSISENTIVESFSDFEEKVLNTEKRLENTHSIFKFKFISKEAMKEMLEKITSESASVLGYQVRSWDGSLVSEYHSKLVDIIDKESKKQDITSEDEETIISILGYLFPIHNVSFENIDSVTDFQTLYGYCTYIGKSFYYRFPNLSGNYIDGLTNIWSLGDDPEDTTVKFDAKYLSMEIIVSPTDFLFVPLKYTPPASPSLSDYDQILLNDEDNNYNLTFDKFGFVGKTNPAFGEVVTNEIQNYKFVFVPVTDEKYGRVVVGGYSNLKNKKEILTFPNQAYGSEKFINLKDIADSNDALTISRSYYNYLKEYLVLESELSFLLEFNTLDKIQEAFGVIPEALSSKTLFGSDMIDMQSRYDLILDATSSGSTRKIERNMRRLAKPSTYTDNTLLLGYAPNYISLDDLSNSIYINESLKAADNSEDSNKIDVILDKSVFDGKYQFATEDETSAGISEQKFNLFIVDKYGQYTKVYANNSDNLTFSRPKPLVARTTSNNKETNLAKIADLFNIEISGRNLKSITKVILTILEVGSGEDTVSQNLEYIFPGIQGTRDGFVFENFISKKKNSISLKIKKFIGDVFDSDADYAQGLSLDSRTRFSLKLFQGDNLLKTHITTIETFPPEEIVEIEEFQSNSIRPSVKGKRFLNIPITNDVNNQPVLKIKSKQGAFDNDLFGYFAIPIDVSGQKEGDVLKIVSSFEADTIKITLNDEDGSNNFPEFKDKSFILCKNFSFSQENSNFNIVKRRKAELKLTSPFMINKNLEALLNIKSAAIFMTNLDLSGEVNDITTESIKSASKSYSVLPIGPLPNSEDESNAFIFPPFIRQISIVRSEKDILGNNPTLKSNTFLNKTLQSIRKQLQEEDNDLLGGFKSTLGSSQENTTNKGQSLYLSRRTKFFMVVFDATSNRTLWRRNYKISIGTSGVGVGKFGGGIPIYRDIINGLGVFIYKNIKPIVNGFQNVNIRAYDKNYSIYYDSTLIRKYSIDIPQGNASFDPETSSLILSEKKVASQADGNSNVSSSSLFDYNFLPYFDKYDLPTSSEALIPNNTNRIGKFTTSISFLPDTSVEYKAFPSALSDDSNSENLDIKKISDLIDIKVDPSGTVSFDIDSVGLATKSEIENSIKEIQGLGEDVSLENLDFDNLSFDIEVNPLSSMTDFLSNIKDNIDKVVNLSSVNNEFVAIDTASISIDNFSSANFFETETGYKGILSVRYSNYNSVRVKVPRVVGIKRIKTNEIILKADFFSFKLNVGEEYELFFEDFNPKFASIEINGIEILDKTRRSVIFSLSAENKSIVNISKNIVAPNNPCQAEINVSTDNSRWSELREDVSNKYMNVLGRDDKLDQYGGTAYEDLLARFSPSSQTQIGKDRINKFCEETPLDFIGEQVCGGGLLTSVKSFCDFSFHASLELSMELKSFKKILVVIKVIFCIIDVLCALMNPKKLAFALIRLFLCLYDLLLMLPQISVPVMAIKLFLHILEVLKCIIDKVLHGVTAINEITDALSKAYNLKSLSAIRNLETVLEKYILTLELDLAILDPIMQILQQFIELMEFVFRFPCQVGAGDDLGVLCLEASNLAGLIAAKVAPEGPIETEFLMPVAQTYTSLAENDSSLCGNTPSEDRNNSESRATILNKSDSTNCDFGSGIMSFPQDHLGSTIITKTDDQSFNDVLNVVTDESKTFRVDNTLNNMDLTYAVSFTKTKKKKFGGSSIIKGADPRRVEFKFNNRAESFSIGKWIAIKRVIDDAQTLDAPFRLIKRDENSLIMPSASEKGEFVSMVDGFSDFTKDDKTSVKPVVLKFGTLGEDGFSLTYDTIPSVAIMDDEFNVYFIEEDGIKYNDKNEIESITAVMINKISADTKKFEKEDQNGPKAGEDGDPYREYSNYQYILQVGGTWPTSFADSEKDLDDGAIGLTSEQQSEAPYPDNKAKNYLYDDGSGSGPKESDVEALADSVEELKIFNFPNLYFIDMRQFTDEIIDACQVNGVTDIFGLMELDDDSSDNIISILEDQDECMEDFKANIQTVIDQIRDDVKKARTPIAKFDKSSVINNYNEAKDCTEGNKNKMCTFVLNPFNTSFKMVGDDDSTPPGDIVSPDDIDPDVIQGVAGGIKQFDFPSITGSEEYASGIGDNLTLPISQEATFEIIPRDSYDNLLVDDVAQRISINIISDTTSGAKVTSDGIIKDGDSYFGSIKASSEGTVLITAQICSKTIKAFSYKGLVPDEEVTATTSCVTVPEDETMEGVAPGTIIRVDRVLTINFIDDGSNDVFAGGKSYKDVDNIANSFDNKTKPNVVPQKSGTKMEN